MDAEHRVITELLALKDAPDDVLLDQVRAIGVPSTHHMLRNEAGRLRHADLQTATDCAALADRIDALIRSARSAFRAETSAELNIPSTAHATGKNATPPKFLRQGSGRQAVRTAHLKSPA